METYKLILSFLSGGLAGAILNHIIAWRKNKIQSLNCYYIEDEVISKLPISFGNETHINLHSKKFIVENTTNQDIVEIKIIFEFEPQSIVTKCSSYSKAGVDIPKGKIYAKKNECQFIIKHFNRGEKIEIYLEIGNINENKFNITELNITGIKVKYVDKRKPTAKNPVRLVEKKEL